MTKSGYFQNLMREGSVFFLEPVEVFFIFQMAAKNNPWKKPLLGFSFVMLVVGTLGLPLISRIFFLYGGDNVWLSTCVQTAGWPIIVIVLVVSNIFQYRYSVENPSTELFFITKPSLILHCALIGLLYGFISYLYSYGCSKLPVSTFSLITSAILISTSIFAFLLVKQRFTRYSIGAIVCLTVGSSILALGGGDDLPEGESTEEYVLGFVSTVGMVTFSGLYVALLEMTVAKSKQEVTSRVMMECTLVLCFSATLFSTVLMFMNYDFSDIQKEARGFELGEPMYYLVLLSISAASLCLILGSIAVISLSSAVFSGITTTTLMPVTEILGVILYREPFQVEKIVALVLSLVGFATYFYGEFRQTEKKDRASEADTTSPLLV